MSGAVHFHQTQLSVGTSFPRPSPVHDCHALCDTAVWRQNGVSAYFLLGLYIKRPADISTFVETQWGVLRQKHDLIFLCVNQQLPCWMHLSGFSASVSLPVVVVRCACTVCISEDTSKMLSEDVTFVCHCFPPLCWGKLFHFICITAEMKNSSETACRLNTARRHILAPKNLPHHTKSGLGSFVF